MTPLRLQPGGASVAAIQSGTLLQFAYNLGRIGSYSVAGALAGAVGSAAWMAERVLPVQRASFVAANLVLIVLGLALTGGFRRLRVLERLGAGTWKRVAPFASRILGTTSVPGAFAAGAAWGWVPCGMVYGVLTAALVSGSATQGALLMLAFGTGTLPNLLALGLAAQSVSRWFARPGARLAVGLLIVAFGVAGLMRIDPIAHLQQAVDVCVQWLR